MSSCLSLIPEAWLAPTPGAPLPASSAVGDWIGFADAQTGALDRANAEKLGIVMVQQRCEARDAESVKALTRRPLLSRLFG